MYPPTTNIPGNPVLQRQLKRCAYWMVVAVVLIALLALTGWVFDMATLKSPLVHQVVINPLTAISLLLCSLSFLLLGWYAERYPPARLAGNTLVMLILAIAVWKWLNTLGIVHLQVDHLLFHEEMLKDEQNGLYAVMASSTSACMMCVGIALLVLRVDTIKGKVPAQLLALVVGTLAFFTIMGYLYRVQVFYGLLRYMPMAVHTAVSFLLLSLGILFHTSGRGLMKTITSGYTGSSIARFLVPAVLTVPVLLGWIRLYGHWYNLITTEFGVALLVLSIIIFFMGLCWYTVNLLNARDREKETAALALQKSEEETKYQAMLLQNISDAVIATDIDFRIVAWNKAAEEMYGWAQVEVLGEPIVEVLQPVYDQVSREEVLSSYLKNGYWKGELKHRKKNGDQLFALVSTTVIQKQGMHTGTVAVVRDITDRKRAEQNFRDLLNAAPDATVIVNNKGVIQMVNKRVEELFNYQREELLGKPVEVLMPLTLKEKHLEHIQRFVGEPRVRPMGAGMELQARQKDGGLFPVEISLSPLQTDEGLLVSASIRDITERRRIEQRLVQFNEELEQQVKARTIEIIESEKKYRLLFNNNPLPMFLMYSDSLQVVDVNDASLLHYGYTREEFVGLTANDLRPASEVARFTEWRQAHPVKTLENAGIWKHVKKDGSLIDVEIIYHSIIYENKLCRLVLANDVTAKLEVERKIKESEIKYRTLVEEAVDGIIVFSIKDLRCLEANKRATELLGYSYEEMLQMNILDLLSQEEIRRQPLKLEGLREGRTIQTERVFKRRNGTGIQLEASAKPLDEDRVLVFLRDITERKAAEEKILQFNEQLRQLSAHLEEVREQERIRISREIHDELGQQLTGLKMDIAWLAKKTAGTEVVTRNKFGHVLDLLDEMVKTVRRISTELRPAVLDDLGLLAAIEWHSQEFEKRFQVKVMLTMPDTDVPMPLEKATGIFRVYQESLTNVARHAAATQVNVVIGTGKQMFSLTVHDNGQGFDMQQTSTKRTLGLLGMKERVATMGGKYEISSAKGKGTTVALEVPV